jgi:hypothetical protein
LGDVPVVFGIADTYAGTRVGKNFTMYPVKLAPVTGKATVEVVTVPVVPFEFEIPRTADEA